MATTTFQNLSVDKAGYYNKVLVGVGMSYRVFFILRKARKLSQTTMGQHGCCALFCLSLCSGAMTSEIIFMWSRDVSIS